MASQAVLSTPVATGDFCMSESLSARGAWVEGDRSESFADA